MNGVISGATEGSTYTFDFPGLNWGFTTDGEWGLWAAAAYAAIVFGGILISGLKGKYGLLLLALLVPGIGTVLAIIGGFRLAKPRSLWARHLYDRKLIAQSIARYEPPINIEDFPEAKLRKGYQRPFNRPSTDHLN